MPPRVASPIFAKLYVELREHEKWWELSDSAYRLGMDALMWSCEKRTDGVLARSKMSRISPVKNTRKAAIELVDAEIWEELIDGSGWLIHDFDQYQETNETIAERSARRSAAGKAGAAATWGSKNGSNGRH